jgi:hypothetical protein
MAALLELMKVCAVLMASAMLGNWFLSEVKKSKQKGAPWYTPYMTIPGIIVLCCVLLVPIFFWIFHS